jgi:hypothetical protein
MDQVATRRKMTDDRRRGRRLVLKDRRCGFERRRRQYRTPLRAAWDSCLVYLRDNPLTLAGVLVLVNLLSLLDLRLTLILFRLGVTEANPVMRYFFAASVTQAAIVKAGLVAAATLSIWALRRRRVALTAAALALALFGAVVLYEVAGLAQLR